MGDIYSRLMLPDAAKIERVIPKKNFYDNTNLPATDKKLFDNIEKIYWRYALKEENAFLQPIQKDGMDFPEIEVIEVVLRKEKKITKLTEVIMRAIPYPMLLVFSLADKYILAMGKQRQNLSDSSKITVDEIQVSDWLPPEADLWGELDFTKQKCHDFAALYAKWYDMLSKVRLGNIAETNLTISGGEAREKLQKLKEIDMEISKIRARLKQETQLNQKIPLNMKLKELKNKREELLK